MNALVSAQDHKPRSVLDERPVRMPIAGKIHTGIKVLTSTALQHPAAKKVFDEGVAANLSYDQIETKLKQECKFEKSPLTPRNTPFFRVSRRDFNMPEIADLILARYGEDRNNGLGRQLYRFPIILPFDDWMQVMPHRMRAFTASGLQYWSEYDAAGNRFCMQYKPIQQDRNQRATRHWGGRQKMLRPDNEGRCDPSVCPTYASKGCSLGGSLLFWIPGIPGSSLIELGTTSFYSMQQVRSVLEMVAHVRNGRLSGLQNGRPIFYLTKVQEEVSRIDNGQAKRTMQYLVKLEADISMDQVLIEQGRALAAPRDVNALPAPAAETAAETVETASAPAATAPADPVAPPAPGPATDASPKAKSSIPPEKRAHAKVLRASIDRAIKLLPPAKVEEFKADAARRFGADWWSDLKALADLEFELGTASEETH